MARPLLRGAAATATAACALALACLVLAGGAAAGATQAQQPASSSPVSVAITSVSPAYAQPGKTVTVSGTMTNTSASPMSGLAVQLQSSGIPFQNRSDLQEYADGSFSDDSSAVAGAATSLPGTLAPHATANWTVTLNPADVPITGSFGVYPLAAQAYSSDSGTLAASRTFLPFWPGTTADPTAQQIAWVWPLIDQPRQAACPGLLNNGLAASLSSGGRLGSLLATGFQYAGKAQLTWAIDPALLANATTMTSRYQVDSTDCKPSSTYPASQAAETWLDQLKTATANQPVIVTPYDDADIAALTGNNMSSDLTRAYTVGRAVASKVLGRSFTPAAGTAASASMNGTAWPADGIADYGDLENLAASDGISTVVLDSSMMPPSPPQDFTPSAQTSTPDGEGPPLHVLLSDDTITQILGTANSPSDSNATAFSVAQRYLAETAMITAEAPSLARSIVVAPPRNWDPPAGLAGKLLNETVTAPWLRPASLGQLASAQNSPGQVPRQAPPQTFTSPAQLPATLLSQAAQLDQQAAQLQSIQVTPDAAYNSGMSDAVMAVESSAWRGGGTALATGQALGQQAERYLSGQVGKVTILAARRYTLGGLTGSVPISVSNGLGFPVKIGLQAAPSSRVSVKQSHPTIVVPAGQQEVVKLQVNAKSVGSTTLQLSLVNQAGGRLPGQASIIVQTTHYGDFALAIIAAALAVFLLTAAARAFRRGTLAPRATGPETAGPPAGDNSERHGDGLQPSDSGSGRRTLPEGSPEADTVMSDDGGTGQVTAQTRDHDRAEGTDDYAWAPGQAEPR